MKFTELMATQPSTPSVSSQGSIHWASNNLYAQVMGAEHSGHVRGVGLGPTPGKSRTTMLGPFAN
jgi:hypothetical protein